MKTKDRLAAALTAAGLLELAEKARRGIYDDFESPETWPMLRLVSDLDHSGSLAADLLVDRVMAGEFDGTPEEAEAWAASADGQRTIRKLMPKKGAKP
jgi:hypothetical protein